MANAETRSLQRRHSTRSRSCSRRSATAEETLVDLTGLPRTACSGIGPDRRQPARVHLQHRGPHGTPDPHGPGADGPDAGTDPSLHPQHGARKHPHGPCPRAHHPRRPADRPGGRPHRVGAPAHLARRGTHGHGADADAPGRGPHRFREEAHRHGGGATTLATRTDRSRERSQLAHEPVLGAADRAGPGQELSRHGAHCPRPGPDPVVVATDRAGTGADAPCLRADRARAAHVRRRPVPLLRSLVVEHLRRDSRARQLRARAAGPRAT